MSFVDANFAILLSFLIFAGLCWRHLANPIQTLLDQQIQDVTQEIHTSAQVCATAQEQYLQAQEYSEKVHKDILNLHERTQASLEKITEQAKVQLTFLTMLKDKAHQAKIEQLDNEKIHRLKAETAQQTMIIFQEILQQKVSPAALNMFTDQMAGQLE